MLRRKEVKIAWLIRPFARSFTSSTWCLELFFWQFSSYDHQAAKLFFVRRSKLRVNIPMCLWLRRCRFAKWLSKSVYDTRIFANGNQCGPLRTSKPLPRHWVSPFFTAICTYIIRCGPASQIQCWTGRSRAHPNWGWDRSIAIDNAVYLYKRFVSMTDLRLSVCNNLFRIWE